MGETGGDSERSPSKAGGHTCVRSVEMGLDVGCITLDLQNDVCGEEESCTLMEGGFSCE